MKLHERTLAVQRAEAEIAAAVWAHPAVARLTDVELAGVLLRIAQRALTFALREERHPDDPEKKADET